jgi:hypothetical protein
MVPKQELHESIPLRTQKLNYRVNIYGLQDYVGEEGLNSNWLPKFGLAKKKIFLQVFLITY